MLSQKLRLNNWDYINDTKRWRDMGSKLWITDSNVYERGLGESDILIGVTAFPLVDHYEQVCSDGVLLCYFLFKDHTD